mmetsp:Transcript_7382/g.15336  ORF Transcript_7382/g.15336 Transcript_7382/m.15336 type:complete len:208 (+) Transcript_7382:142-765(+)
MIGRQECPRHFNARREPAQIASLGKSAQTCLYNRLVLQGRATMLASIGVAQCNFRAQAPGHRSGLHSLRCTSSGHFLPPGSSGLTTTRTRLLIEARNPSCSCMQASQSLQGLTLQSSLARSRSSLILAISSLVGCGTGITVGPARTNTERSCSSSRSVGFPWHDRKLPVSTISELAMCSMPAPTMKVRTCSRGVLLARGPFMAGGCA